MRDYKIIKSCLNTSMQMKYKLPFPKAIRKKIIRPIGEYTHENFLESKYAIDFILDVDTPILAARSGKVIKTKFDSNKYGLNIKLADKANYVAINHGDETYAEYIHFGKDKVEVQEDQDIKTGDLLGYSGLSGCMSRPHLHFNVFKIKDKKSVSIPVKFI